MKIDFESLKSRLPFRKKEETAKKRPKKKRWLKIVIVLAVLAAILIVLMLRRSAAAKEAAAQAQAGKYGNGYPPEYYLPAFLIGNSGGSGNLQYHLPGRGRDHIR